ncbi:hypothetical protein HaLaN_21925, partial [Haematococcus lacustris]
KLKFSPPCEVELVLEPCAITGAAQSAVYRGRMQESACKGYYSLNAAPKALTDAWFCRSGTEPRLCKWMRAAAGCALVGGPVCMQSCVHRRPPLPWTQVNPRVVGITTSIRVDFLRACFGRDIEGEPHVEMVRLEPAESAASYALRRTTPLDQCPRRGQWRASARSVHRSQHQPQQVTSPAFTVLAPGADYAENPPGVMLSLRRQGSYYVLGLPFALVHGREFCAWRQLDEGTLELSVQDIDPAMAAIAAKQVESSGTSKAARGNQGIVVDSRISIPLAMLKRDLAEHLDRLLPMGMGPSFDIPSRVQYRVDGKLLPRVYDNAVIKKSEHRGCCYLNGTERIPVKSKMLTGLELDVQTDVIYLDFRSNLDEIPMRSPPTQPPSGCASATPFN